MRIGIIGTENSHADHYVRHFNTERRFGSHGVTALSGGDSDRNRDLAAQGGIEQIVAEPSDLIGKVDAAIVCSRDGAKHPEQARPLLAARLPVLIDKPLACDVAGAQSVLSTAREARVPVASFSALRLAEETRRIATGLPDVPELVAVAGPADRTSEYGGLFFYGIHVVELALALAPGRPVEDVAVADVDSSVVITARAGRTRLLLEFDKPGVRSDASWRVRALGPFAPVAAEIRLGSDYIAPVAQEFVTMLDTGRSPLPEAELLAPVEILAQANSELDLQSIA
ncbi:MAG TPA: Gfo/Idh/MocA family oxidoreductase [Mycobacteriales bacterium]|nr:Gfo/Idh/MocA family oxidoreductase [Mycobacteriales bacterium]